jgi:predicted O-methyltransferase YrrM
MFLDHCKDCYLPDLRAAERLGLVTAGTVVMADNVVYPGA